MSKIRLRNNITCRL